MGLPLLRGTTAEAKCDECPFASDGRALRPVTSEYPEKPAWILIGEGPGRTEVQVGRPFCGSALIVDKTLAKIGRKRDEIALMTAVLCASPVGKATDIERDRAVAACKPRLMHELAQWPGMPILTLGAVAARAVIPKATLDAIDPPNVPKIKKRSQKERQRVEAKLLAKSAKKRAREIAKLATKRLKVKVAYRRTQMYDEMMAPLASEPFRKRKKPPRELVDRLMEPEIPRMKASADVEAVIEYEAGAALRELQEKFEAANPKPKKPLKPKPVKITDIVSTCFEVDIDGTGPRPIIPTIHPVMLLKGGGATIGGTHTPDLAFINLIYDASKVNSLAAGKDIRLKLNVETETTDPERTWQLLRDIVFEAIAEGECAIDLETYVDDPEKHHALMAYMARVRTIGIATEKRAISIMWGLIPSWGFSLLQLMLAHLAVIKTFHNGLYDRTVLAANGFVMAGPWADTLLAHHAAFPGNAHRLQVVASQFFATSPWKSEFRNAEETPEGLTLYNAKDTGATRALRPALTIMVKQTSTERVYALDRKMSEIASHMHLTGMPVDREVNSDLLSTFSKNVAESRRAVEAMAEDPKLRSQIWSHLALQQAGKVRKADPTSYTKTDGSVVRDLEARYYTRLAEIEYDPKWKWKIGAGKHITALLQALSIPLHQVTASGQISTKKDVLEGLADHAIVRDILTFRENDKLLSTFIWRIFDRYDRDGDLIQHGYADEADRIHSIWSVHKITGRWASSEPVVSNVPKDKWKKLTGEAIARVLTGVILPEPGNKFLLPSGATARVNRDLNKTVSMLMRPNLRAQIRAPKGRVFIGGDFAQIEYRIIALLSGDPHLCRVFETGGDIHIENAKVIWPDFESFDKATQKEVRERAKPLGYGAMYLAQVETLHKQLLKDGYNLKLTDVATAIAKLLHAMQGVVRWQRETIARASQPPYEIRDIILGRRRTWPLGQVESTEAVNFGVQTTAASVMNQGLYNHSQSLRKYRQADLIGQFHDAAIVEAWEDDAEAIAVDQKRDFEQVVEHNGRRIPFLWEPKIGTDWTQV